jgi:hypothetical protein
MTHIIPAKKETRNRYVGNASPNGKIQNTGRPITGKSITRGMRIIAKPSLLPITVHPGWLCGNATQPSNVLMVGVRYGIGKK